MDFLTEPLFIYALVFAAIVLPTIPRLFARNDALPLEEQSFLSESLPSCIRALSGTAGVLELPLGEPLKRIFASRVESYTKLIKGAGVNPDSTNGLTPAKLFAMKVITCGIGIGFGLAIAVFLPEECPRAAVIGALFFLGFVGWVYPTMKLESYVQWRRNELTRSLPFAIDLISSAMRAGLDFGAAMRYYVGLKMPGPLTEEFGAVLKDTELGKSRVEALNLMAERVQTDTFTSFAGVVAYGTEIGASISETLRVQGDEMRRARFHLAERKAARAPSLMIFPLAVFIMPAVFIIIVVPVMMQMGAATAGK